MNSAATIQEIVDNPSILNGDICYGFYDWFCRDSSLKNKSKYLMNKVNQLVKLNVIDPKTTTVTFKNNCPMNGSLYDDIRLYCEDGEYLGCITPSCGHTSTKGECSLYLVSLDDILKFPKWKDFKKFAKETKLIIG